MKFWVGVTDNDWFSFLGTREFDEVNFWHPSAKPPFKYAPIGMPFLFKLKKPNNAIAGGGFFVSHSTLPISLAWEVFGEKNGTATFPELREVLRTLSATKTFANELGCTVLSNPFFLSREHWLNDPPGWSGNIVRGKSYDTNALDGAAIWDAVKWNFLAPVPVSQFSRGELQVKDEGERYGEPILVRPRLGQASFRVLVTEAYHRRCAMTGESTLVALEAAHIKPYANLGAHDVRNGLLLRADFHRLFDVGLVGVTPDLRIRVSPKIREAWFNGKVYYRLNDQPLAVLPARDGERPDPELLEWHMQNCFQG